MRAPSPASIIDVMFRNLDQLAHRLRAHVEHLAAQPRPQGSAAHRQAKAYIAEHLERAGFQVTAALEREAGFVFENLLTAPVPADGRLPLVIVAAHYDSVPGSPGADDNASAVAALLELARWLGPRLAGAGSARIQLAAYDLEEMGLIGSYVHARALRRAGAKLRGMISLEMLGYTDARPGSQRLPPALAGLYPDTGDFIGIVGNEDSEALLDTVGTAMRQVPDLPVEHMAVPGDGKLLSETRLSDHSSFWDHGFPALMITDTSFFRNPHYHAASDRPETLDYPFLARVTAGVCAATWKLLHAEGLGG
jgi:Zn-dependent M28 family amino/carboxypeptidase